MSNPKLAMLIFFIIVLVLAAALFAPVLGLFLASAIVAYLLDPFILLLQKKARMKKWLAVVFTLVVVIALVVLMVQIFLPALITQIWSVAESVPSYTSTVVDYLEKVDKFLRDKNIDGGLIENAQTYLRQNADKLASTAGKLLGNVANIVISVPKTVINLLFAFMLTIYFLFDGRRMLDAFINFFSPENKRVVRRIINASDTMLWRYVKSKVLLAFGMMVVEFIGFMIFGVENALLLAIMAFVMDFIPYVGSFVAGLIAAVAGFLTGGLSMGIGIAVFVTIVQQIQGNVIAPKLQADSVGVHPAVGIFSLLACSQLMGAPGLFVAIPIAGLVQIVFRELAIKFKQMK